MKKAKTKHPTLVNKTLWFYQIIIITLRLEDRSGTHFRFLSHELFWYREGDPSAVVGKFFQTLQQKVPIHPKEQRWWCSPPVRSGYCSTTGATFNPWWISLPSSAFWWFLPKKYSLGATPLVLSFRIPVWHQTSQKLRSLIGNFVNWFIEECCQTDGQKDIIYQ